MLEMEQAPNLPVSPGGGGAAPLQPMSPDRVNQQRESTAMFAFQQEQHHRDSEVHDKIRQFNNMSHINTLSMSKQLERKTADAALKRAMLGREEAENEMRRYREEARALRRQVEEGRERERRVGERLETVMENYGRAKETHSHTQALWEKEIRRARKETFKAQSTTVKLQEELKTARNTIKSLEEVLAREKERSKSREQEAFESRYQLVGLQEQLEKALERVKAVEQERDAFKTLAKNEEVARIAAEGRIPLPPSKDAEDEFASPRKARFSLSTADIVSSASSEAEIDELTRLWQWERQRADRTQEQMEFLETECHLRCCPGAKAQSRKRRSNSAITSPRKERPSKIAIIDAADHVILGQRRESPQPQPMMKEEPVARDTLVAEESNKKQKSEAMPPPRKERRTSRGSRRSTRQSALFVPSEGIFRTLSQQDLHENVAQPEPTPEPTHREPSAAPVEVKANPSYARTPSAEPPAFALLARERDSLSSLLNAPHDSNAARSVLSNIPTTAGDEPPNQHSTGQQPTDESGDVEMDMGTEGPGPYNGAAADEPRPGSAAAAYYQTVTQTTSVPLRDDTKPRPHTIAAMPVAATPTPNGNGGTRTPSFDASDPALNRTMSREEALAQIKERRSRSRSGAQQQGHPTTTPRRPMGASGTSERRDVSAHVKRAGSGSGSRARSVSRARPESRTATTRGRT